MRFQYDEQKNQKHLARYDVDFETAALVFDDPYAERFGTLPMMRKRIGTSPLGEIRPGAILFVAHT
jgi:uncharacterized DUF497 family protein